MLAPQETSDPPRTKHSQTPLDLAFNQPSTTIEETLENCGLLKKEIQVYLHLAESGLKKANDICSAINIHRTETYRLLRNLAKKGLVSATILDKPIKFFAVPIDQAIDLLLESQKTKLQMLENQKKALVELWKLKPQKKYEPAKKELFQKIEGIQQIISKAEEILERTVNTFEVFISDEYMAELYYGGFFDSLRAKRGKDVALLIEISQKSTYFLDKIKWPKEKSKMVETQNLPLFIISDQRELLIAFTEGEPINELGHKKKLKNVALWTNYPAVVSTLQVLFKKLDLHAFAR